MLDEVRSHMDSNLQTASLPAISCGHLTRMGHCPGKLNRCMDLARPKPLSFPTAVAVSRHDLERMSYGSQAGSDPNKQGHERLEPPRSVDTTNIDHPEPAKLT